MSEDALNLEALEEAGRILRAGGLVAFPTETVYGLGGNALDPEASRKIYAAKGRPSDNPLIVHIAEKKDLYPLATEVPEAAERLGIAVMGPNCAGFVNYIDQVYSYAFISAERDRTGSVGVISQSGQLCLSMMEDPSMRFSYIISAGNAKLVQMEDYMEFLVDDPDTKVIALYLEGVKNPTKFIAMLQKAAKKRKPVVILKVGRSAKSQAIAASHTGSLTGSDKSFDAVLKKFGAIRVDDLEELIAMSMLLSTLHVFPKKATFTSMSLSGGETSIIADVASQNGIVFPDFEQATLYKLNEILPDYATPNNPLDMTATPSYDTEAFASVVKTVASDPNVGMILVGYTLLYEIADPCIHYMYAGLEKVIKEEGLDKPIAMLPFAENTRNPEYQAKLFDIGVPILPPPVYGFKLLKYLAAVLCPSTFTKSIPSRLSN